MAFTVQQLIEESLRFIGVLASGETPNTTESGDALVKLNQLLLSWNAQALPIYKITRTTIGMSGSASVALATRPIKIKAVSMVVTLPLNVPLRIATPQEWAAYIERGSGDFGEFLYYEDGYPLGKVNVAPKVSSGSIEIEWDKAIYQGGVIGLRETFNLSGAANYTVGVGGTWATERPVNIKAASILAGGTRAGGVDILSAEMWAAYPEKGSHGSFPEVCWCDYGMPVSTLYLAPRPASGTLEVYTYERLVEFTGLTQDIQALLPDGYLRALTTNLGMDLASEYGAPVTATHQGQADDAKTSIFGLNASIMGPPQPAISQPPPPPAPPPAQRQAPPQGQ